MGILAVLLLRLVLRKAPRAYSCALWLLVLARLLCPVFPEVSFSPMPQEIVAVERVETYISRTPVTVSPEADTVQSTQPADAVQTPDREPVETAASWSLRTVLAYVWLAGAGIAVTCAVVSLVRLKGKLRMAVPIGENAYLADHIDMPFVIGLIRPRIYLPSDLPEAWTEHILLHERCHIRRGDPAVKNLFFLALCIHWFNPLVWLAYGLLGRDMEMSCDEAVMRKLGDSVRTEYAESLLCLATGRRRLTGVPLAFGEGDPKRRIRNVLNYRKPKFWVCLLAVILCAAAAVCILTNPKEERPAQLEYPGLEWNMSPEEVKQKLGITEEMIVQEETTVPEAMGDSYRYAFKLENVECFGAQAGTFILHFVDTTGTGKYLGLSQIIIYYPDGQDGTVTDMAAVRARLTELYGEYDSEITYFEVISETEKTATSKTPNCCWVPEARGGEYLSEADIEEIMDYYRKAYELIPALEGWERAALESWEKAIRSYPLVQLTCVENYMSSKNWVSSPSDARENGMTEYSVRYTAEALVQTLQFLEHKDTQFYDAGLLEYPNIPWLSTPDAVKKALSRLDEEVQILSEYTRDTEQEDVSYSYAEYRLRINGMTCFGQKTQMVEFCFHDYSWTMNYLQLAEIRIYYPDGYDGEAADLKALVDTLTLMYGDQTEEVVHRFWGLRDEITESREPVDSTLTACWYSTIGGRDLLSQEQKEALYQQRIANKGEQDWLPTLEEYLTTLETGVVNITLRETYYYGGGPEITEEIRAEGGTNYVLTLNAGSYVQLKNIDVQLDALNTPEES